ncbi:beta-galactosidase [Microbacterium sp. ISL-59]|uniref:beta-galactosidase n=1 Tax=Microbacterium sp. ISL-59 TaxID=2819159 RepID=UPI001BECDEBB|nr:beta-galactosidase [Microbacterium sp. ISL-59]MBT2496721.1 beta-galactosidase [Microbacterium sp. ISL-59]
MRKDKLSTGRNIVAATILTACAVISSGFSTAQAVTPDVPPFPIGIFWSPDPANTTAAKYQEIKDMNATYALLSNGIFDYTLTDAALTQCAAAGLKCVIQDNGLGSNKFYVEQTVGNDGKFVTNAVSLGQTFTTPANPDTALDTVELYIDKTRWTAGRTLTLSLYDSPSKTTLIGSASITGPVTNDSPVFGLYKWLTPNTTYYMELTSNDPASVGWVVGSSTDVYSGGTAYQGGSPLSAYDFWFRLHYGQKMYSGGSVPSAAKVAEIADHYKTNPGFLGYNLTDEPPARIMTGLQETMELFRQEDPDHLTYMNLLPNYAADLGFGEQTGVFVSSASSSGQTFKTNSGTTKISTIQLYIDNSQWGANEALTLKLWDSPAKTSLISQQTKSVSSTNYPQFTLNATVSPNTEYYWELTHDGGGDNAVGWVVKSTSGTDWEKDGKAYVAGSPSDGDFWFTINQNLTAFSYEDYVYRWASKRPDFLMYDHYPFSANGGESPEYYSNMEVIRRQSLAADIPFWTYIQSVGIPGSLRVPTEGEMRYQVFTSLAYGAKGINYFTYVTPTGQAETFNGGIILPDGTKSPLYTYAKDINAAVQKLGPTLLSLTSQNVYHTGTLPSGATALPSSFFMQPSNTSDPLVFGYSTDADGRKYVMVTNRDTVNSRTVSFSLSPKPSAVTEVSKTTEAEVGTNYDPATGTLSSSFAPGEGRLYALPPTP